MHKQWIKDGLSEYLSDAHAVWHMPGHKRKACYGDFQDAFLAWDVTEVPGTDDLYLPEGIYRGFTCHAEGNLPDLWHVLRGKWCDGRDFYGNRGMHEAGRCDPDCKKLPQIGLQCGGDAAATDDLCGADWKKEAEDAFAFTSFIDGYVDADDVERLCESHPEIAAVVVTSPTYEGVISDIAQIARVAHAHHVRVIVDEAHGAHLPFFKTGIFCDPHGCRCRCTESAQDTSSDDADSGDSCLYRRTGETGGAGIGDILKFFAVVYFHDEYGSGNLLYGRP